MLPHLGTRAMPLQPSSLDLLSRFARQAVFRQLGTIQKGWIELIDTDGTIHFFGCKDAELHAQIEVLDPRFYRLLVTGGANGAAEAWCLGFWKSHELVTLLRIFVRDGQTRREMESGTARVAQLLRKLRLSSANNTRGKNKLYIAAHYDLGNSFFAQFLDETMMYSAAIFDSPEVDLHTAQARKNRRICELAGLRPGMEVLEIGSGWGGFAAMAAGEFDCQVTTTTISEEQFTYTCERIRSLGLSERVTVIREDYRDLQGQYDAIVSIEMIEAIGAHHYDDYFAVAARCLKPDGRFVVQAITIDNDQYERASREVDFIKQYIFPGSCIPCEGVLRASSSRAGLVWESADDIGQHYATTLAHWRDNFLGNLAQIRELGLPASFIRMWVYYFCYCEAGFHEAYISNLQITLRNPGKSLA